MKKDNYRLSLQMEVLVPGSLGGVERFTDHSVVIGKCNCYQLLVENNARPQYMPLASGCL